MEPDLCSWVDVRACRVHGAVLAPAGDLLWVLTAHQGPADERCTVQGAESGESGGRPHYFFLNQDSGGLERFGDFPKVTQLGGSGPASKL